MSQTHILHRNPADDLPIAVKGDGPYIIDQNGKKYLDASGGAAVSCLGHSNAKVTQAIKDQLDKIAFAHSAFFTSSPAEELADFLVERAPDGLDHVYLVCGGSEATESALKLARQYFLEKGENSRKYFIARRQSYHGNTLGALSVGGNQWRRKQFEPILIDADHVSPCYPYRDKKAEESDVEYGLRVANDLETAIKKLGPENVIAFVAEPVVGATSGALVPVEGYFKRIREICDEYGILLILDEVMCGMGRTGSLFACAQEGISPDILTIAKGLGAGYQPVGAMLLSGNIYQAITEGSGFFQHGHTYLAHPTACAAALAVQKEIEENDLIENVNIMGAKLEDALNERFGNHPYIGDIRGRGLFWGLEIVSDRASKEPFPPEMKLHALIKKLAMDEGLICYPGSGTIDGLHGTHILLAPPFIISDDQVEELVSKLGRAVDRAFAEKGVA
ncbi:MAG: aspartate aminotransferase family protein [Alphaproteobacteria bacterium]|nr:aspartate aminotransferase family protein [Alphaproteobacteria bacterium]